MPRDLAPASSNEPTWQAPHSGCDRYEDAELFSKRKGAISGKRKSSGKRSVERDDTVTLAEATIVGRSEAQLKRGESKPWRVAKDAPSR